MWLLHSCRADDCVLRINGLGFRLRQDFRHSSASGTPAIIREIDSTLNGANAQRRSMKIYQIKITLLGIQPAIWRRLLVPADTTLRKLHRTVQIAMGWTDSHLHQFRLERQRFSGPQYERDSGLLGKNKTKLCDVVRIPGNSFLYEYDFGDGWQHKLLLEEVLERDDPFRPICVAGERRCPPEDCGGPPGFAELREVLHDPTHPRHDEMLEWIDGDFDPEYFDLTKVNRRLSRSKG